MTKHVPVLLGDVMAALGEVRGMRIIDATFGAGGYTRAFLEAGAIVTAFDRDPNVAEDATAVAAEYGGRFTFVPRPFSAMAELDGEYDAIVFDLGISSMQIDIAERGFSFRADGPLDMRMSSGNGVSAADLIARTDVVELARILRDYGDVKKASVLARAIKEKCPQTTLELRDLIYNPRDIAPVFQALRIAVNDEMGEIRRALAAVPQLLCAGGKCICVTFHSLEDRIVKNTFREWTAAPGDPRMPAVAAAPFAAIAPTTPSADEVRENPRARSAHMRGVIKSY
ncbi:MAG: 16S rRNA (cytosine(1402)-N(4))-methyltransferase RsmH [Alphaproteobacteria bacterium]|nr:16S rRNA (cytosine(1402)-N(4))-methyltransferase RsmH [Alphaproteobacteria bacterium]